jgi:hypothetical protein
MDENGTLHDCHVLREVGDGLIAAVRAALRRPAIDPETIMHLGGFLRLVLRLPKHDEDQSASMALSLDTGEGVGTWRASFGSDGLELYTSEIFRGRWGSDHESRTVFHATPDRCDAEDDLDDWLWNFKRMAEDAGYAVSGWCESLDEVTGAD